MVRAAYSKLIDYEKADFDDPWWWYRLKLTLDEMQRQDILDYYKYNFFFYLALLSGNYNNNEIIDYCRYNVNRFFKLLEKYQTTGDLNLQESTEDIGSPVGEDKYKKLVEDYYKFMEERKKF
jgi:hypothetical protein